MATQQTACTLGLLLLLAPATSLARTNILTAGLSTYYDYDHPQYETVTPAPQAVTPAPQAQTAVAAVAVVDPRNDDTSSLAVRPLLRLNSNSQDDQFELRAAPAIRYDLIDSESDWDADFALSYARSLTMAWRVTAANAFVRSDSYDPQARNTTAYSGVPERQNTSSELSANRGRSRYWRNTANVASEYLYGQDSLVRLGYEYEVLRNDNSEVRGYEDHDRSAVTVTHNHRYNPFWTTGVDVIVVRGEYDENTVPAAVVSSAATVQPEANSGLAGNLGTSDLWEYHLLARVENTSFRRHRLGLAYTYIGTAYDEELENDQDIHELQAIWRHDYSQQLTTTLGAGPSYIKTENKDATWGSNGIAALDYQLEHGNLGLAVVKGYEPDNFSGTEERGVVNFWDTRLYGNYQVVENVTLTGLLEYRHEDRDNPTSTATTPTATTPTATTPTATTPTATTLSEYTNEQFSAGGGLTYAFMRYYSAALNYTFIRYESERIGEDYDDHRLLLTLSWEQEWLRW